MSMFPTCYDIWDISKLLIRFVNLDYCVAAFGIILIISTFQWFVDGRKNFTGPRADVDVIAGEVAGGEFYGEHKGGQDEQLEGQDRK